jgi:hypothetical protein
MVVVPPAAETEFGVAVTAMLVASAASDCGGASRSAMTTAAHANRISP